MRLELPSTTLYFLPILEVSLADKIVFYPLDLDLSLIIYIFYRLFLLNYKVLF